MTSGAEHALISVKPIFAADIMSGAKTVELRRRGVRLVAGDHLWIYATKPIARVVGIVTVHGTVIASPATIWRRFGAQSCITKAEFEAYTDGCEVVSAIQLSHPYAALSPVSLEELRRAVKGFQPPQYMQRVPVKGKLRQMLARAMGLSDLTETFQQGQLALA